MSSRFRADSAFTLLELLIVITIIIILAGLTIATMGYVQDKAKRSRAEAEIAAFSTALENYKADNGIYPRNTDTDSLDARTDSSAGISYQKSTKYLYGELAGDRDFDGKADSGLKSYFGFKPQVLFGTKDSNGNFTTIDYIQDPFGKGYGYSTAQQASSTTGYNPTFDLWSTAGSQKPGESFQQYQARWIKNW